MGLEYVRSNPILIGLGFGVLSSGFLSTNGSLSDLAEVLSLISVLREVVSDFSAVFVAGSGSGSFPVTMSASQSPRPPGAASTAVCGL